MTVCQPREGEDVEKCIVQVLGVGMVVVVGVGTHSCQLTNCCQQTGSDNTISMVIYALYTVNAIVFSV